MAHLGNHEEKTDSLIIHLNIITCLKQMKKLAQDVAKKTIFKQEFVNLVIISLIKNGKKRS
jgi:hypothetical protein